MKIIDLKEVYEKNNELDNMFIDRYGNTKEINDKNKMELLVELGEFANESRCFKYWSIKKPDREKTLFEYADVMMMTFYFFYILDVSLDEEFPKPIETTDVLEMITYLFKKIAMFRDDFDKETIKDILVNTLKLGELMEFSDEEIISFCLKKIAKTKQIFSTDY